MKPEHGQSLIADCRLKNRAYVLRPSFDELIGLNRHSPIGIRQS